MFKKRQWPRRTRDPSAPAVKFSSHLANCEDFAHSTEWNSWLETVGSFCLSDRVESVTIDDNRPHVELTIGLHQMKALIDTGANRSLLSLDAWNTLKPKFQHLLNSDPLLILSADGSPLKVLGTIKLPVEFRNRNFEFEFIILPAMSSYAIIGADLLGFLDVQMRFSRSGVHLNSLYCAEVPKELPEDQASALGKIIQAFGELTTDKLTRTHLITHSINTGDNPPVRMRQYPFAPTLMRQLNTELDSMLEEGVVSPSNSPWCSPVLMVRKKSGEYRFCFDGRMLNSVTVQDSYPLPRIDSILSKLNESKFLSTIDLKSAFWQIPLDEASKPKTAFAVPGRGLFHFNVLPFGIADSPRTMQRLIDNLFGPSLEPHLFGYLDDLIISTSTIEKHIEILTEVHKRLKTANLTINLSKCKFVRASLPFLGFIVDSEGIRTDPEKVKTIHEYPRPSTVTQIKRFLGMIGWYRRFIPDFSTHSAIITALMAGKKKSQPIVWSPEANKSFEELKSRLTKAPVLVAPDFSKPFTIQTDASATGLAAVLFQEIEGKEHPIAYASKTMNSAQKNYSVTEQECLAVLFGIEKFRPYVEGSKFRILTDHHSLLWLRTLKNPTGRLCRWAISLAQYDFTIEHRKGSLNVVADAASRINVVEVPQQTFDPWYNDLRTKISTFPEKYPSFRIKEQKIFRCVNTPNFAGTNNSHWKLLLPKELRKQALLECHDEPLASHLGTFKTLGRLRELYYWPDMKNDVIRYVRACSICAKTKASSQAKPGLMGQVKQVRFPFQMLSIDFLGPLPRSRSGNQHILVVTDCFTKYVFLKAFPKATSRAVCKFLEEDIFLVFGVPQSIICDNGSQFISKEFTNFIDSYKVQKIFYNAKYHPQHNPAERVNRTIISAISGYLHDNHRLWDVHLPKIAQAIRLATHVATGKSPSFLTFGRLVPTAGNFYGPIPPGIETPPEVSSPEKYTHEIKKLAAVYPHIWDNLKAAHSRATKHYNLRRREVIYRVGDKVWKKNVVLSSAVDYFSSKLAPKFIPCEVTQRVGNLVYRLQDKDGNDLGNWHVKDLKPDLSSHDDEN